MKIYINYSVCDAIEVPDDWDDERIQRRCRENWVEFMTALNEIGVLPGYDDMKWQSLGRDE